jgi:replicative DNA helicase
VSDVCAICSDELTAYEVNELAGNVGEALCTACVRSSDRRHRLTEQKRRELERQERRVDKLLPNEPDEPETAEAAGREKDSLAPTLVDRLVRGGMFIFSEPEEIPAVWGGASGTCAWAAGEPLMLVGPDGVGKTTVGQLVILGRIGLRERVLGMRVRHDDRPVLYLAMDRPRQAARSLKRMVNETEADELDRRLIVWKGPLPFDVLRDSTALADMATRNEVGTVVIDSLKDLAAKLSDDEVGGRVNIALQEVIARDVEVLVLHHQRKQQQGASQAPKTIADVYGSRWLTAGMGSIFCLWGDPGDPVVEFTHLKQPLEPIGPWKLLHDHDRGETKVLDQVDVLGLVNASDGLTAEAAAAAMFGTATPTRNEVEKARRRLDKLADGGFVERAGGPAPSPVTYHPKRAA